ncbi:TPA: response regulator transcription factor [Candidatus Scatenecus faecavium]|uniref:Response regulator transcription factor n=1 Tax=Candidatus Scatenecus faecavium TaxID=2840915 RepID=A0A9D1FWU7_9BACT|nr:response regulator transcription factor [Candidatus Scatenecus faecavium]
MSSPANILLVDDNPKYLKDALPYYGYNVRVAIDGLQALEILTTEKNNFDLVLLDVMMPNIDGWQTLKAIRTHNKTKYLPVIMITAVSEEQKVIAGLRNGADDYITKPFVLPNLLARMEAVLRRSEWVKQQGVNTEISFKSHEALQTLTSREREVLTLAAKGANNRDIAEKLVLKEVTVKSHLNSIFKKLNVASRTQAVLLAMQMDLIKN